MFLLPVLLHLVPLALLFVMLLYITSIRWELMIVLMYLVVKIILKVLYVIVILTISSVYIVHYVGGLVGLILTGIFAQQSIIALGYPEGTASDLMPKGGWLDGNWMQVPYQLAGIAAVSAWSFVVTYVFARFL
jgi:ammonia channel protein AmtB